MILSFLTYIFAYIGPQKCIFNPEIIFYEEMDFKNGISSQKYVDMYKTESQKTLSKAKMVFGVVLRASKALLKPF